MLNRVIKGAAALAPCLLFAACASVGPNESTYTPPKQRASVKNKVTVDAPFDQVWDHLVAHLSASYFVINNIDKASRLLNVSFSTNKPDQYINCGIGQRVMHYKGTHTYRYDEASSSEYEVAAKWGPFNSSPLIYDIHRDASLTGRINVYVAPISSTETTVAVNARYIFQVAAYGVVTGYDGLGPVDFQKSIPRRTSQIAFNTETVGSGDWGNTEVKCRSKGLLEHSILSMASAPSQDATNGNQ